MTELPEHMRKNFGSGPRTFRTTGAGTQDSSWTDTPTDRAKKQEAAETRATAENAAAAARAVAATSNTVEAAAVSAARRKAKAEAVDCYNAAQKRPTDSLMQIHVAKRKRHAKDEKTRPTNQLQLRQGWDRERDMKAGNLDPAKRKELLQSLNTLDSRFAP